MLRLAARGTCTVVYVACYHIKLIRTTVFVAGELTLVSIETVHTSRTSTKG